MSESGKPPASAGGAVTLVWPPRPANQQGVPEARSRRRHAGRDPAHAAYAK